MAFNPIQLCSKSYPSVFKYHLKSQLETCMLVACFIITLPFLGSGWWQIPLMPSLSPFPAFSFFSKVLLCSTIQCWVQDVDEHLHLENKSCLIFTKLKYVWRVYFVIYSTFYILAALGTNWLQTYPWGIATYKTCGAVTSTTASPPPPPSPSVSVLIWLCLNKQGIKNCFPFIPFLPFPLHT